MRIFTFLLALTGIAGSAGASIITFTNLGDLQAAATLTTTDDFESYSPGTHFGTLGSQGITFSVANPATPYIASGEIANLTVCDAQCLTASGNEIFTFGLTNGNPFTAVGFDVVTNQFAAPNVEVYGDSGLIASFILTQGPNTRGYFGLVSDEQITSVRFVPTGGEILDTALDNVTIGTSYMSQVPEPAVGFVGSIGLLGLLAEMRRRSSAAQRG